MSPLQATDEALIQRVASHVLEDGAASGLPALAWHFGLCTAERQAMHIRWPLLCALWDEREQRETQPDARLDRTGLLRPLHALLMQQRAVGDPGWIVLANVLACACFGSHHLWQDLGATGRDEVSRLIELGFPALFASNTHNLRWKRHLFLVLGEQLGRSDLRPPKCDGCDNFDACFGSAAEPSPRTWPLTRTL